MVVFSERLGLKTIRLFRRVGVSLAKLATQAAQEILKTQLKKTDLNKRVDADIKSVGSQLN